MTRCRCFALVATLALGCGAPVAEQTDEPAGDDLPVGELSPDDMKADGYWGAATTCKAIPDLPGLAHPEITISLDGLTLHLVDRSAGYDRVFPVGVGAIDLDSGSSTYLESRSYYPLLATGGQDFTIRTSTIDPCKVWWTDPATRQRLPVFAGLPFMSWWGNYGIHGPIDNYRAPGGGNLTRGYVSHGCIRMEAADVLEVYARIRRAGTVPVHVQREPERGEGGDRVDVPGNWVGSECRSDADCGFAGGSCHRNPYGRGFCSLRCTTYCADKAGYPTTFCVADPDAPGSGMCTVKANSRNYACRPYDQMAPRTVARNGQTVTAQVCMPGSAGWVGDHCLADADCTSGTHCAGADADAGRPGICTMPCTRYCPDQPGTPWTFCVDEPALGGATCVRQCTPESGASECPSDSVCVTRARAGEPSRVESVCLPR